MPTFSYTGGQQTYVVPAGITQVVVECWGAQGGEGINNAQPPAVTSGGQGGYAKGLLAVTPGETLYVNVGGAGIRDSVGGGGWNGGGNATDPQCGGGGGGTDVRRGGTALGNRVIVAGGGSGATYLGSSYGGGLTGYGRYPNDGYGEGGSQTKGGYGGGGGGAQGGLGYGGNGAHVDFDGGSGGGGGYYGGGGGGVNTGNGSYPGGGGSGYIGGVTDATMENGGRTGHGLVVIAIPPTVSVEQPAAAFDPRLPFTVSWGVTSPEGGTQQQYEFGYKKAADSTWTTVLVTSADEFRTFAANTFADETDYDGRVKVYDGVAWSNFDTFTFRADSWTYGSAVASATQSGTIDTTGFDPATYEVGVRTADAEGFGPWSAATDIFEVITTNVSIFRNGAFTEVERFIYTGGQWVQSNPEKMT